MVKVGLVTGPVTPRARAAPRTNVVFPEPSSPETVTTSPGSSSAASWAASSSVSAGDFDCRWRHIRWNPAPQDGAFATRSEETELHGGLGRNRRQEDRLLRRLDLAAEQLRQAREVGPEHLEHARRVQGRGRVVGRIEQ